MNSVSLYEKREELKRLLQSKYFAKAKKKSRFLEFICEQTFLGNAEKLNEFLVGIEIYERGPGFNPQDDPIVRVQAHEIRRALKRYYEEEGKESNLRIDLPPGHYVPVFSKLSLQERGDEASACGTILCHSPSNQIRHSTAWIGYCAVRWLPGPWFAFSAGTICVAWISIEWSLCCRFI